MDRQYIMEQVKALLQEKFELDAAGLSGETRQQDMGIDSILMVDLMLEIESRLGFSFDTLDLPKNPSIDEICELIENNLTR